MHLLLIAFVYLLGATMAMALGAAFNAQLLIFGLVVLLLVSSSVHFGNEYADYETDALTQRTLFSGGSGALPGSTVPRRVALRAGWCFLCLALQCWQVRSGFLLQCWQVRSGFCRCSICGARLLEPACHDLARSRGGCRGWQADACYKLVASASPAIVLGGSSPILSDVSAVGRLEYPTQGCVEQLPGRTIGHSRWIPLHKISLTASFGRSDDHDGCGAVWGVVFAARGLSSLSVFNKDIGPVRWLL